MEKELARFLRIWIGFSVISIAIIGALAIPGEITMDVWVPGENTTVANEISAGVYTDILSVQISGTAVTISMQDYKQKYHQGDFVKNSIIVEKPVRPFGNGVYYLGSNKNGMVFVTKENYENYPTKIHILARPKEAIISGTKDELAVKILYKTEWWTVIFFSILICALGATIAWKKME